MKMGTTVSPWRYDATFNFARLLPRADVSRRCCYDDHPDFGWGHRLLPLKALTRHGCIKPCDRAGRRCRAENDRGIGLCPLLCGCAQLGGGARSMVDYALGVSAALLRSRGDARRRDPVDRRRSTRACRLVCTLFAARIGHAGADRTDAEPRSDGSLSLRAQSYLRGPCRRHSGPSGLASAFFCTVCWCGSPFTRLSWGTRSRRSFIGSERSTRFSGPTSRAGFRGSRPGEPHDARIIRDTGAAAGRAWKRALVVKWRAAADEDGQYCFAAAL